jgi:hypothetical protein
MVIFFMYSHLSRRNRASQPNFARQPSDVVSHFRLGQLGNLQRNAVRRSCFSSSLSSVALIDAGQFHRRIGDFLHAPRKLLDLIEPLLISRHCLQRHHLSGSIDGPMRIRATLLRETGNCSAIHHSGRQSIRLLAQLYERIPSLLTCSSK